jgi:heat shock protein HtpX
MERRTGRDFGLSVRMAAALLCLAVLYLPLPVAIIMFVLGWTGSWLLAVGAIAALFAFLFYLPSLSERVALASTRAREVSAQEESRLHALVARLAAMADLPVPRIAVAPTEVPNAFTVGRAPRDAVVVVTRGLLSRLSDQELEVVLAHELAHVEGRDAFVMTLVSAPAVLGARFVSWVESLPGRFGVGSKVLLFFVLLYCLLPLFLVWVLYAIAVAIVRTISRYREFIADRGAVLLTGAPEQLMSALQRLAADLPLIPKDDLREVAGASALFIVPAEAAGGFSIDPGRLFPSHPPLEQRLERLSDLSRELGRPAGSKVTRPARDTRPPLTGNPKAPLAFFCAAVYWCFIVSFWLGGDPFRAALPVAVAWIAGVVLGLQGAGRASAGASGMGFAVGALALLVGPWVLGIVGFFVVFLLSTAGVGPY